MTRQGIKPRGESFRQALRWLSDRERHDAAAIEEAAIRFDLTPLEEDFLLREARRVAKPKARRANET